MAPSRRLTITVSALTQQTVLIAPNRRQPFHYNVTRSPDGSETSKIKGK
jgi:hypothetical protein